MQTAVIDACVLYPAPLQDFFMRLAVVLYQPKWTDDIHEEWIRNVLKDRPDLSRAQLTRTRLLMDRHGGDCMVTGYKRIIPTLSLPDRDDRHVLAAAISGKAAVIVTFNLSDFPQKSLEAYGITAMHPDQFALSLYREDPANFISLVKTHRQALKNPPKNANDYLSTLEQCGLKLTTSSLRKRISEI